jgi:hypothetical protein
VLISGKCPSGCCDHAEVTITIRDILQQTDYPGTDYEDGAESACVRCPDESCDTGIYVTDMCTGTPQFDTGKFHNHCKDCPDGGVCMSDYRIAHCVRCGHHTYMGQGGIPCENCGARDPSMHYCDGEDLGDEDEDEDEDDDRRRPKRDGIDDDALRIGEMMGFMDFQKFIDLLNARR